MATDNEIKQHIDLVNSLIKKLCIELKKAGSKHDASKLQEPEKKYFNEAGKYQYGTKEYFDSLERLRPAINHHYQANSHHPEHHKDGVSGMTLIDLVEMYCDWRVRAKNECEFLLNLEICQERFNVSDQIVEIFKNTESAVKNGTTKRNSLERRQGRLAQKNKKCKTCNK